MSTKIQPPKIKTTLFEFGFTTMADKSVCNGGVLTVFNGKEEVAEVWMNSTPAGNWSVEIGFESAPLTIQNHVKNIVLGLTRRK